MGYMTSSMNWNYLIIPILLNVFHINLRLFQENISASCFVPGGWDSARSTWSCQWFVFDSTKHSQCRSTDTRHLLSAWKETLHYHSFCEL